MTEQEDYLTAAAADKKLSFKYWACLTAYAVHWRSVSVVFECLNCLINFFLILIWTFFNNLQCICFCVLNVDVDVEKFKVDIKKFEVDVEKFSVCFVVFNVLNF